MGFGLLWSSRVVPCFVDLQPITFAGTLTLQDALDLHRYRSLCQLRPAFRWLIGVVSALIATALIGVIVVGKSTPLLWVFLVMCAYFPIGWWFERRLMVRWQYRRHPEYYVETTVTVDEKNVSIVNASMDLRLAWSKVGFLLDTPRGLVFMLPTIQVLCFLPQRLFVESNQKTGILEFAARNNIPVRLMK